MSTFVESFMDDLVARNPGEPEFHQAVREVAGSIELLLPRHPEYRDARILERMVEP
ncbi:MAG TPA: glutamate dehydrogenase, partial [Actinobacteria bacterium]|nr:glutamate dehydrogenase [Actinomycetota bacterium]